MLEHLTIMREGILQSLKKIQQREETGFRIDPHRFSTLSDLVGSIRDSAVVGGVAGHGKSQLVQQMTVHGALNQTKVVFCDFENPLEELHKSIVLKLANIVSPESGPTVDELMKDPEGIINSVESDLETLQKYFYIFKPHMIPTVFSGLSFGGQLEQIIPELLQIPGKGTIVVIDSFDELFKGSAQRQRSMTETADFSLELLRSIKEKHQITLILICEYTKSDQTYKEYSPKWSSSIGHFARLNLFIKKPGKEFGLCSTHEPFLETRIVEVIRNQYGKGTGSIKLIFDTERLIFTEAPEDQRYE